MKSKPVPGRASGTLALGGRTHVAFLGSLKAPGLRQRNRLVPAGVSSGYFLARIDAVCESKSDMVVRVEKGRFVIREFTRTDDLRGENQEQNHA